MDSSHEASARHTGDPPSKQKGTNMSQIFDDGDEATVPFPIAIVGVAMRLPGGITSGTEFWDFLIKKRDGLSKVPDTRYNVDAFYSETRTDAIRTQHGHFLQHDITKFDAGFFGISKIEAARLDPQQRLLLEVVWECMENGGQVHWRDGNSNIGCYVGAFGEDWLDLQGKDPQVNDRYRVIGAEDFALSNLAGTNLIITPTMTKSMSNNMVISTSGICRTFDAKADGYGRGEAINAIFIKPLQDALRDEDPIRAVIRSTAVNCDGKTPNITTPGLEAQEQLIRRAYQRAKINNDGILQTGFFECHGTGTTVGDTIETSAVANVFKESGIYIGAVKPNVGHSEGASGITSVIKGVLALENKAIPPNVHFKDPNPNIPFKEGKLQVPMETIPWPIERCKRVSINSFGIGGTNAHV
ncbi:hypothetical protein EYZ11_005481 [Aspergillus tanneri]|uniref:Ketosynthase family 3 (KS3) domain-containing protein n=1 Tax=Aspergillus tanneri TaxID=1220188 RepID=A0A4S3JI41_9EURO|nr:hypothetical protein EYZ11_005481 [Aspergillus tanneri]